MKRTIFCMLLAALGAGCSSGGNGELRTDYFQGELTCYDDSATLRDCATAYTYAVSPSGVFPDVRREYDGMGGTPHAPLFIACRARVIAAGAGRPDSLVIDGLIDMSRSEECASGFLLPGIYGASSDSLRQQVLQLRPDRTFRITRYSADGEHETTGTWGLASELELVLSPADSLQLRFEVIPDQESLAGNGDAGPLVFRKVYL